ncbi:outer membrane beta-barrel protein [Flavobacterium sp. ABG]|uniref:outer membrane beta-barrel protein n=1 Tax=Flavobacterium sp. ABG TaxID=1423322 RepID=UPI001F0B6A03|nr:outer membrane beta-barrel protein [Flavobacterium sp. ABG]
MMSQKKIVFLLFVFFTILQTQAQVSFKPGLRGGLSLSSISEMHGDYKPDFYVGGFGEINLTKRYALQPEITYTRQGSNDVARNYFEAGTSIEKEERLDLKLDYLSLSLLNKFTFGPGIQIQFGPSLDVLVEDNLAITKNRNDISFISGVAYRFPSGLTIEARFKKGFLDVLDSSYYSNNSNNYYWLGEYNVNNSFQFGVSYIFGK